jgi:hypothetical protein
LQFITKAALAILFQSLRKFWFLHNLEMTLAWGLYFLAFLRGLAWGSNKIV